MYVSANFEMANILCYQICSGFIQSLVLILQDRRIAKDTSQWQRDYRPDDHVVTMISDKQSAEGTSDTAEGDSGRKHHQPTRWR